MPSAAFATGVTEASAPAQGPPRRAGGVPLPNRAANRERGKARSDSGGASFQAIRFLERLLPLEQALAVEREHLQPGAHLEQMFHTGPWVRTAQRRSAPRRT